jgi:hypothetical protein
MLNIFIVNGYPQSGKTYFGQLVGEEIRKLGGEFVHLSSITPIKLLLKPRETWNSNEIDPGIWDELEELKRSITEHDWDGETKDEYWRATMFNLKHALTEQKPDFIHHWVYTRAQQLPEPRVIFVDIRESHNILAFEDYCLRQEGNHSVRKIFVESDSVVHADNFADREVDESLCDFRVINNRAGIDSVLSVEQLRGEVVRFIETELPFLTCGPERR